MAACWSTAAPWTTCRRTSSGRWAPRRVVAVNVGDLCRPRRRWTSRCSRVAGATLDAMMRANTKVAHQGGRHHHQRAARRLRLARLAPQRRAHRRGLQGRGGDARPPAAARRQRGRIRAMDSGRARRAGGPRCRSRRSRASKASARATSGTSPICSRATSASAFNVERFETDLAMLSGLDRYETITWRFVTNAAGENGLLVQARPKPYGPPFLMLGLNLENTTSEDFRVTLHRPLSRLRRDRVRLGAAHRRHARLGSRPRRWRSTSRSARRRCSSTPYAGIVHRTFNVIQDDAVVASYGQRLSRGGMDFGVNLGRVSDLRLGAYVGRLDRQRRGRRSGPA